MDVRTAFFALAIVAFGVVAALLVAPLLQYVMAAGLLAFVLHPIHRRLESRVGARVSAGLLTAVAVVAAVVPLLVISLVLLESVASFLADFDRGAALDGGVELLADAGIDAAHVEAAETYLAAEVDGVLSSAAELVLGELLGLLGATIRMSVGVMVLVFVLYYLLVDGEALVAWLRSVLPLETHVHRRLFAEIETVTWAVIESHVLVALVQGLLGGFGLYVFGLPNVVFWTAIMVVVAFLPIVGVWLVWGPAVGYLYLTGDPTQAVALALYGVAVLSLVDNYLRAIFVDRNSGLHPAVVLVGVIGGIYLLGIMGLFLGPVLLAVFKASLNVFEETHELGGR